MRGRFVILERLFRIMKAKLEHGILLLSTLLGARAGVCCVLVCVGGVMFGCGDRI